MPPPTIASEAPNSSSSYPVISESPEIIEIPEWHPITQHLSADNKARIRAAQPIAHPTPMQAAALRPEDAPLLPFTELPAYQIECKSYAGRIEPGTVRFGVPPAVKLPDAHAETLAVIQILRQLNTHHPNIEPGEISFFKKNKQTIMDIEWSGSFRSTTPLEIDGNYLAYFGSASAFLPANWVTLMIQKLACKQQVEELVKQLNDTFYPHQILDCWSTSTETNTQIGICTKLLRHFTGKVVLLLELDMDYNTNGGYDDVDQLLTSFPGFVAKGLDRHKFSYLNRRNHCTFCKSVAFEDFHTFKECQNRLCKNWRG